MLPNHEFNIEKKVISKCKNLKWNYEEFEVDYQCLKPKYLVWKYYLTKLLNEENLEETKRPYFTKEIVKPIPFWNELKIRFMSTFDNEEQKIILKTMAVLYNTHFDTLKELKSLPYWLKLVDQPHYQHCHFILLQLVHIAFSINDEILAQKNLKKFIKSDGLRLLFNAMKLSFTDLNNIEIG